MRDQSRSTRTGSDRLGKHEKARRVEVGANTSGVTRAIRFGQVVRGKGANMDNQETPDERRIMPRTCFSSEPGVYRPHV